MRISCDQSSFKSSVLECKEGRPGKVPDPTQCVSGEVLKASHQRDAVCRTLTAEEEDVCGIQGAVLDGLGRSRAKWFAAIAAATAFHSHLESLRAL